MKRFAGALVALFFALSFARQASAWDGVSYWYEAASGSGSPGAQPGPGAGGILGTGGAQDYNITCANCHIKGAGKIGLSLAFDGSPAPSMYTPGHTYSVVATMTGEHLGLSGCMGSPPAANNNNFAFTAEDASGNRAGSFRADLGDTGSCPASFPPPSFGGGTYVYGDCHAVLSVGADRTTWSFSWTAPPSGTGGVTLFYAAVDGDCMMNSLNDDVKVSTWPMGEGTAALERRGSSNAALAWMGWMPIVGLVGAVRRRRRRHARPRG